MATDSGNDKRVVAYVRVSGRGNSGALSMAAQKKAIEQFAAEAGYQGVDWYVEEVHSGHGMDRPAFQNLIEAAERQDVAAVVVYNLSRLSRDVLPMPDVFSLLQEAGVRVVSVSVSEGLSIDPADTFIGEVIASVSEWTRRSHSQAIKRGMGAARRRKQDS